MNEKEALLLGTMLGDGCLYLHKQKNGSTGYAIIVSGFFATDGSLVITNNNGTLYPRIEFQNISYNLLRQIKEFLSVLRLEGGLYKMKRKSPDRIVYRLQYNGKENLLRFKKEIGFINPKHQLRFDEFKMEMLG